MLINLERIGLFKNVCIEIGERYHFDAIETSGDYIHVFVGAELKYTLPLD